MVMPRKTSFCNLMCIGILMVRKEQLRHITGNAIKGPITHIFVPFMIILPFTLFLRLT